MFKNISSTKGTQRNVKREYKSLVLLGVLAREIDLEWGVPPIAKYKHKTNRVYFLIDFRNKNKN